MSGPLRRAITWALLASAVGFFVLHARVYWDWTEDDAFITFRYAQNLTHGAGLVFNPGERVEGYSNFSWVLTSAAALRAGLDPVEVSKIVGILAGALCILVSWRLALRLVPEMGMTSLLAPFYLAISPVLVEHSVAGLETSLYALFLALAVLLATGPASAPRRALLGAVLLLLMVTRPEAPLLVLLLLGLRWGLAGPIAAQGQGTERARVRRAVARDAGLLTVLFGAYYAWRSWYFGAPLPNTFYAKVQGGFAGIIDGVQYTLDFMRDSGGPLFIGLALLPLIVGRTRPGYWMALGIAAAYMAFVVISGGDWMYHYRFYAHVLPVLAALLAAGLEVLLGLPRPGTLRASALYASLALVLLATHLGIFNTELRIGRMVLPAVRSHNYLSQNYEELGRWFKDSTPPDASIAISDVGAVGYFSERRVLDMFGLIDTHIARLHGRMHYKGDAKYILSRKPSYVVLVSLNDQGGGYSFQRIPDHDMNAQPEFHEEYELIRTVPQYWQNEFLLVYRRRG